MDQRELVGHARRGDHDAFAALVDPSLARLDAAARLILRDPELARDAVQEALIRAWRDLPGLRDPDRFEAWLHRLTVNACLDLVRRRRRRAIEVEITPIDSPMTADHAGALADREVVDTALKGLDPGHRAVVALHYLLGMPLPEVAAALGIPLGTTKSRLHYALAAMRTSVTAEPGHGPETGPGRAGRMTTEQRFERQLPAILEDLYLGPSPDYRDEVLAAAVGTPQRPAWTFPGRWLPMADIASRPAFAPRAPWRTIGVAFVIIALLLAAAVVFVGSRQTRLPPPFGIARNGQVVYAAGGDIYTADVATGTPRAIVTGPGMDGNPRFSRDGTHVAFMRRVGDANDAFVLVVAKADGTEQNVLTPTPLDTDNPYEWSPDGSFLLFTDSEFRAYRIEADGSKAPMLLRENAYVQVGEFRPPDGNAIVFEPQGSGHALWVMNADGTGARLLHDIPATQMRDGDFGSVRYSPDGSRIAFLQAPPGDTNQLRVHVMDADGTDVRQLSDEPGSLVETDLAWSPDGTSIAFDRWRQDQSTLEWVIQPLGIVSVDGGETRSIGPTPVSDGAWFDFSPDGTSLVSIPGTPLSEPFPTTLVDATSIDVATGQSRVLHWNVGSMMTWQRLAP